MAGNVGGALLLAGMGVEALSMDPGYIPRVKQALCNYSQAELRALTRTAVTMATAGEVGEMLGRFLEERAT
jgi:phosphoenolpyruvate-protein kinase (PTS system EI component)